MRHRKRLDTLLAVVSVAVVLASPSIGRTDDWQFPAEKTEQVHAFGTLRIVRGLDARQDQYYPLMWVDFFDGATLLAKYPGFHADAVHASKDRNYFLLLSNSGLSNMAYALLDSEGRLVKVALHGPAIKYCTESVTLVREWYDEKKPNVRFETMQIRLDSVLPPRTVLDAVKVRGCDGKDITIAVWQK